MRTLFVLLVFCTLSVGCTHVSLQRNTLKQETTLTDLQYRQVLNNVAMLVANRGALPYFALSSGGTAQVSDSGGGTLGLMWDPFGLTGESAGLNASRSVTESWTLAPVLDPDKLLRMRCAYQVLICDPGNPDCDKCADKLKEVLGADFDKCYVPHGWYCVGKLADVPKNACYVGHYKHTYVWVMPGNLDGLSRFTLTVLDLASASPPSQTVVRKYDGQPDVGNPYGKLKATEVTAVEAPIGDATGRPMLGGPQPSPSRTIPRLNPAIQLTPR